MDNITHSLFGALVGEAAFDYLKDKGTPSPRFRRVLVVGSVLANNFPDLDFLYASRLGPSPASYLAHHRGVTHTLIAAVPQAILLWCLLKIIARKLNWNLEKKEWLWVGGLVVLGQVFHLLLDGLNSYGIHPFWPFDSRWYYGDSLFIVEPWIWLTLAPLFWFLYPAKWYRLFLSVLSIVGLGLCWFSGMVDWPFALLATAWPVLLFFAMRKRKTRIEIAIAGFALASILVLFASLSGKIRSGIRHYYAQNYPGRVLNDVILSPSPVNPLCWRLVLVDTLATKEFYSLRRGLVVPFPSLYSLARCGRTLQEQVEDFGKGGGLGSIQILTEVERSVSELKDLLARDCVARAYLKFSRAPYLERARGQYTLRDARFESRNR